MANSGQTLNDRINAARYALAGQGLARCVCKATTEEIIGPKKKHLDYLVACTHEPNVSIPQLANLLIERTNHLYWVVVFKALVTVHHLMSYGNERFTQYLASCNFSFQLHTFLDKTASRDFTMSNFIRKYSRYINEKALSYRLLAFDFCKIKRGNEGVLRLMPIDRLLKTLPILQDQLDTLLEFDCSASDLNNGVINACFMLLFRDLIGLFACHNDGIINLLNKYFTLNRKMCREAFELYKKFLTRMDRVSEFLRVAEVVGIERDEIPDLRKAPSSICDALEQHLQNIESNKKILKQQSSINNNGNGTQANAILGNLTPPSSRRPNSPNSSSSGRSSGSLAANQASGSSQSDDFSLNSFKDEEVRKALEEEARVLSQYGTGEVLKSSSKSVHNSKTSKETATFGETDNNSPKFAVTTIPKSIDDIFGDSDAFVSNNMENNIASVAFDNLSNTSSSSSTAKTQLNRPDFDSIKSAIISATSTLENSKSENKTSGAPKKASDELFSLLDSTTTISSATSTTNNLLSTGAAFNPKPLTLDEGGSSIISAFTSSSPFDLPSTNGQLPAVAPLKPINDFGIQSTPFSTGFGSTAAISSVQAPIAPIPAPTLNPPTNMSSSTMNSEPPKANYTNLGGLEGFGDLLQPMNSSSVSSNNNNKKGYNGNFGSSAKTGSSGFNSGSSGLSSTGLFKGDLDSTLANLAQNLTFDGITANSKTKK